jgi:hypothetical protein
VSKDPAQSSPDTRLKPMTFALCGIAIAIAGLMPVLSNYAQFWNMSVIGAIGLFAASRLGFWWGVGFTGLAIGFKDASFYLMRGWPASFVSWPCFMLYAVIGWAFLRKSQSPARIGAGALSGSLLFFFVNNFTCWLEPNLGYEQSLSGLAICYIAAIPFYRGTLAGDLVFSGVLFGAHAALSRAYSSVRQPVEIHTKEMR